MENTPTNPSPTDPKSSRGDVDGDLTGPVTADLPPAGPAPLSNNAFLEAPSSGEPEIPSALQAIAATQAPQIRARLKALDPGVAQVQLKARNGRVSQPTPLSFFVLDFASEAAELMATGGPMLCSVNPGDGTRAWSFGFLAPTPENVKPQSAEQARLEVLESNFAKLLDEIKTERALAAVRPAAQQQNFAEQLQAMAQMMAMVKSLSPDPAEQMGKLMGAVSPVLSGVVTMNNQLKQMAAPVPKPDDVETITKIMQIPVVNKLAEGVATKMLAGNATIPDQAQPVENNAFASAG